MYLSCISWAAVLALLFNTITLFYLYIYIYIYIYIYEISNFASDQKRQTKEFFRLWIENSSLSKAILFLAFQIVQNKHKGSALQTFLFFLPTNEPCQPKSVSLTNEGST